LRQPGNLRHAIFVIRQLSLVCISAKRKWIVKTGGGYQSVEMVKRILVVDDESDICFVLERVLGEKGFVIDSYENPLLALEKFKPNSYNLVILDIKMPDLNGFALYREIKRVDKKVKICYLTAGEMYYGVYSDIFSSLHANCFIRKPIDNEELMKRINEIIVGDTKCMDSKQVI
jgi:DNA-binding response OmpR family regulator